MMVDDAASPTEPRWLLWAREIQALAQTGLAFPQDQYNRERYQRLRALAAQIMADHASMDVQDIEVMFTQQTGYATPKVDVRGAVFRDGSILLVRETADEHRWSLPGGWADVNESPAEAIVKEMREEAGLEVRALKLGVNSHRHRCRRAGMFLLSRRDPQRSGSGPNLCFAGLERFNGIVLTVALNSSG